MKSKKVLGCLIAVITLLAFGVYCARPKNDIGAGGASMPVAITGQVKQWVTMYQLVPDPLAKQYGIGRDLTEASKVKVFYLGPDAGTSRLDSSNAIDIVENRKGFEKASEVDGCEVEGAVFAKGAQIVQSFRTTSASGRAAIWNYSGWEIGWDGVLLIDDDKARPILFTNNLLFDGNRVAVSNVSIAPFSYQICGKHL